MKKSLLLSLLWALLLLSGCRSASPSFPPDAAAVVDTAVSLGFDWTLSEEDTVSYPDGRATFSLYGDGHPGALIGCSGPQESKVLQIFFGAPVVEEKPEFSWLDWEKHLSLATRLYGNSFQEEELCQALSSQDIPELKPAGALHMQTLTWNVELPSARCTVSWIVQGAAITDGEASNWTSRLSVTILETADPQEEPLSGTQSSEHRRPVQ